MPRPMRELFFSIEQGSSQSQRKADESQKDFGDFDGLGPPLDLVGLYTRLCQLRL